MAIQRRTKSVKAIQEFFENRSTATSVVDLVDHFKEEMNKSTVYRILEKFEEDGLIHSFRGKDGLTWYAKCADCSAESHDDSHPHFQCQECGKVECLPVRVPLPSVDNHNIKSAEILLLGQCEACTY